LCSTKEAEKFLAITALYRAYEQVVVQLAENLMETTTARNTQASVLIVLNQSLQSTSADKFSAQSKNCDISKLTLNGFVSQLHAHNDAPHIVKEDKKKFDLGDARHQVDEDIFVENPITYGIIENAQAKFVFVFFLIVLGCTKHH